MRGAMQIEVLGERYQLQEPIGRGGMATIYRGRDMRMDRVVAIKVLREVYSTDPKFVTRFQREAKAASALQHPNIVQVFDYGQSDGNYFIVMELVEGTDLRRYLRSRGILATDRAVIIAHDVALGLGAAHRRAIVHRDVKPQNVLVGRDGSIKLTDFGIASVYKDINDERLTTTGMTLGTVQYYAPEQAQGEIVNPAADVYALGIVMYEMLTGRTPFDGDTPVAVAMQHIQDTPIPPRQLNPNIPPALEEIILRCLEKIPEMRYRDGSALARALELLGEEETGAPLPTSLTPGGLPTPSTNGSTFVANRSRPAGTPAPSTSSPDHRITPSYIQNGVVDNNAATTVVRSDQQHAPAPLDQPGTMTGLDPHQAAYSTLGDISTSATRPFRKDSVAGSATTLGQRESRLASIITLLILAATLLLLGFSIYLAAELGFLSLPFKSSPAPTATSQAQQVSVPNLQGMSYQQALKVMNAKGFKLQVQNNLTTGIVKDQSPKAGDTAPQGSTILVDLEAGTKVPTDLIGKTLAAAEAELSNDGIQYVAKADPNTPNDPTLDQNIVSGTNPAANATVQSGQTVTVYVVNYTPTTSSATGTGVPTPVTNPTQAPAVQPPTATPAPQPTPTAAPKPTVAPAPSPTAPAATSTASHV